MCFLSTFAFAQKATFTGKFKEIDVEKAGAFISNASDMSHSSIPMEIKPDGSFSFELDCEKPSRYYIILEEPHTGVQFYAEKGMKADMQVSFREVSENGMDRTVCDVVYTGDNKDCYDFIQNNSFSLVMNKVIMRHYGKKDSLLTFSKFREEFRYEVDKAEGDFANVGTTAFRKYMYDDYEYKFVNSLGWFENLAVKTDSVYDAFVNSKSHDDPADMSSAYDYAQYVKKFLVPEGENKNLYLLNNIRKFYSNEDVIKYVAGRTTRRVLRDATADFEPVYQAYLSVVGTPTPDIEADYNHYKSFVPGQPGVNFTMTDAKGKKVKFSQLKGKAVYFDMWATWCGPCCAQIPYMEKLAEHYKGDKRIQIISVSLDKNQDAWHKKIAKDKPQWPQYIMPDNFDSDLCKAYDIQGIPRFMMFDKNGKIIAIDAPRPSEENIIEWIEKNLK